jgi:hypothetical protein
MQPTSASISSAMRLARPDTRCLGNTFPRYFWIIRPHVLIVGSSSSPYIETRLHQLFPSSSCLACTSARLADCEWITRFPWHPSLSTTWIFSRRTTELLLCHPLGSRSTPLMVFATVGDTPLEALAAEYILVASVLYLLLCIITRLVDTCYLLWGCLVGKIFGETIL